MPINMIGEQGIPGGAAYSSGDSNETLIEDCGSKTAAGGFAYPTGTVSNIASHSARSDTVFVLRADSLTPPANLLVRLPSPTPWRHTRKCPRSGPSRRRSPLAVLMQSWRKRPRSCECTRRGWSWKRTSRMWRWPLMGLRALGGSNGVYQGRPAQNRFLNSIATVLARR